MWSSCTIYWWLGDFILQWISFCRTSVFRVPLQHASFSYNQGFFRLLSAGNLATLPPPPPRAEILQLYPPLGPNKISLYLVLKGSKKFRGTFGAAKTQYTPIFSVFIAFLGYNYSKNAFFSEKMQKFSKTAPSVRSATLFRP